MMQPSISFLNLFPFSFLLLKQTMEAKNAITTYFIQSNGHCLQEPGIEMARFELISYMISIYHFFAILIFDDNIYKPYTIAFNFNLRQHAKLIVYVTPGD